jgi:hypothetical protein
MSLLLGRPTLLNPCSARRKLLLSIHLRFWACRLWVFYNDGHCPPHGFRVGDGVAVKHTPRLPAANVHNQLMTLPISDSRLCEEALRQDRLVACLRADDPLAGKAAILPGLTSKAILGFCAIRDSILKPIAGYWRCLKRRESSSRNFRGPPTLSRCRPSSRPAVALLCSAKGRSWPPD